MDKNELFFPASCTHFSLVNHVAGGLHHGAGGGGGGESMAAIGGGAVLLRREKLDMKI